MLVGYEYCSLNVLVVFLSINVYVEVCRCVYASLYWNIFLFFSS